jgi:hypothetical protein
MLNGEERCRRGRVGLSRGDWLTPPPPLTLGEPGVEPHQERARAGMARGGATGAGGRFYSSWRKIWIRKVSSSLEVCYAEFLDPVCCYMEHHT